jgi:hypothetical protein
MSISMPANCANPECGESSIMPIHCASHPVAIDDIHGPPVFSHFTIYRCTQCGHTWGAQRYSSEERDWPARDRNVTTGGTQRSNDGWWARIWARS